MPTNMYGPGDNYDLERSHVLPAMIRKFHEAKIAGHDVTLWGDGSPLREFLHADDCADALVFLMENYDYAELGEFINVGSGQELTIRELAAKIGKAVGFHGKILWDMTKPNGTPRKLMDRVEAFRPRLEAKGGARRGHRLGLRRFSRTSRIDDKGSTGV